MTWLVVVALGLPSSLARRWTADARLGPEAMTLVLDGGFVRAGETVSFHFPHPDHPMSFAGTAGADVIDGPLEVSFAGEGRSVSGSLLLPQDGAPDAALALFHATSGESRDDLRFYADLAARQGMAALIYDRRSVPIDLVELTRADFLAVVADAEAATRFLRSHESVEAAPASSRRAGCFATCSRRLAARRSIARRSGSGSLAPVARPGRRRSPFPTRSRWPAARRRRSAGARTISIPRASSGACAPRSSSPLATATSACLRRRARRGSSNREARP